MKCVHHKEQEAVAVCLTCHQPVCGTCLIELGGKQYCSTCLEKQVVNKATVGLRGKGSFLAFILSLFPGVGYLYLGLMRRGLQTMVVFYGTIFLAVALNFEAITALVLPVIMFYTVFDTLQLLKQINEGQSVEDKLLFETGCLEERKGMIGGGLIVIGAIALLNNLLPHFFAYHYYLSRVIPAVLIITLGVYILVRNGRRSD